MLTRNATNGHGREKGFFAPQRGYRKTRLGNKNKEKKRKPKQLEFCVEIGIEEDLPQDPQILVIEIGISSFFSIEFVCLLGSALCVTFDSHKFSLKELLLFFNVQIETLRLKNFDSGKEAVLSSSCTY